MKLTSRKRREAKSRNQRGKARPTEGPRRFSLDAKSNSQLLRGRRLRSPSKPRSRDRLSRGGPVEGRRRPRAEISRRKISKATFRVSSQGGKRLRSRPGLNPKEPSMIFLKNISEPILTSLPRSGSRGWTPSDLRPVVGSLVVGQGGSRVGGRPRSSPRALGWSWVPRPRLKEGLTNSIPSELRA